MSEFNCPLDCTTFPFESKFDDCTPNYQFGEVTHIYIASRDYAGFTDVTDDSEIAQAIADGDVVSFQVKGSLGEPEQETTEGHMGVDIDSTPKFTLEFEILEITKENYESMQKSYCNIPVKMWYETRDARFGGEAGISPCKFKMFHSIEMGFNTLQKLPGRLQWFAKSAATMDMKVTNS